MNAETGVSRAIRIVVADDHALIREAIRRRLQGIPDIEMIGEASNGNEFLELMEQEAGRVDVAIVDIHMPPLNGLETIAMLRARDPHVEVLIFTGRAELLIVLEGLRVGAKGYLLKHRDTQLFTDAIRVVARGDVLIDADFMEPLARFLMRSGRGQEALTPREVDLFQLAGAGRSDAEIAGALAMTEDEVRRELPHLLAKLEANQRTDSLAEAFRRRLTG